jgi:hypothetical protein
MALLDMLNEFSIDVVGNDGKKTLKGTFRDLTKAEKKDFDKKTEELNNKNKTLQKKLRKIKQLEELIEIDKELKFHTEVRKNTLEKQKIENEFEDIDDVEEESEKLMKERFDICLSGEDADEIKNIAEVAGYRRVYQTISEAVAESKEKK